MPRTYRIHIQMEEGNSSTIRYRIIKAAKKPFGDLIGYVDTFSGIKAKVEEIGALNIKYYTVQYYQNI